MSDPRFVPQTQDLDLTEAMATVLRVNNLSFDAPVEHIVSRAFTILWAPARGGYTYAQIKPRLLAAIDRARVLGPIDLNAGTAA
ncbi:hypothetical protein [Bradyrhizobium cenepequi]